jgi:hypothetical protein
MLARIFLCQDISRPGQRRLRAGWRILAQTLILVAITVAFELFAWQLIAFFNANATLLLLAGQFGSFIAITLSVYLARRFLDHRSMSSLGLQRGRQATRDLVAGFLTAGAMMLAIFLILWAGGWLAIQSFAWQNAPIQETILTTLVFLGVFIIVGWQEELLARGYWLQNISEGLNIFWGVLISSLVFSLGHLFNPNMGSLPAAGLFLAGLFLAYAYLRSRRLWLPIGLHIGWNFFEGTIFGFPVSGLNLFGLIELSVDGPALIHGGPFGPEAGLVLLPALALGTILVYYYTRLEAQ